jgi:hypothetical protein
MGIPICRWFRLSILGLVIAAGCGRDGADKADQVDATEARAKGRDTPDGAVLALVNGLKNGHPEAFWEFLPASYQADLNDLIHVFAGRMDGEIWRKSVTVLRKLAGVLKSKQQFLPQIGPPRKNGEPPVGDWGKFSEMLETLMASDLADLDRLKSADAGRLLATAGGQMFVQIRMISSLTAQDEFSESLNRLADLRVTLISSTTERATLKFEAPNDQPTVVEFLRIEGKWIPQNLAEEWIEKVGEARAWLSLLSPDTFAERKPEYLEVLTTAESALDTLARANSQEEFNGSVMQALFTLKPQVDALVGTAPAATADDAAVKRPQPGPVEMVTVIVKGKFNDDAQDALKERLCAATDDSEGAQSEMTGDDETTTVKVGPVGDVEAFVRRLEFLSVTGVDAKARIITATMKK